MTPDRKVVWRSMGLAGGATLLVSPDCPKDIRSTLVAIALDPVRYAKKRQPIGEGCFGKVYKQRAAAYKIHREAGASDEISGLSALRANVIIQRGLSRLALHGANVFQDEPPRNKAQTTYELTSPVYYGAVWSCVDMWPQMPGDVWAMSYEEGTPVASLECQPPFAHIRDILDASCRAIGADPEDFVYDIETNPWNMLFRSTHPNTVQIVKLDTCARVPLRF